MEERGGEGVNPQAIKEFQRAEFGCSPRVY